MPEETPRAEIGIVFVHGIGDHQESETLLTFGEPMADWLAEWLRPQGGDVSITNARLRATPTEAESPAFALAEISVPGQPLTTCLMTEAWWGDSVRPPDSLRLLGWLLTRGPLLVFAHYCLRPASEEPHRERAEAQLDLVWHAPRAAIIAGIVQLVTLVALILWIIPLDYLRQKIAGAVRVLTLTLGDSFVMLEQEFQRAAFVERVKAAITWAAPRVSRRLVVIAHSQGGAISHEALEALPGIKIHQWTTVGSGLEKLAFLQCARRLRYGLYSTGLCPLVFGLFALSLWQGFLNSWAFVFAIVFFFTFVVCVTKALNALEIYRRELKDKLKKPPSVDAWLDIFATRDLVPAGAHSLVVKDEAITRREIVNLRSLLQDHTSYFQRPEQSLPLLWSGVLTGLPDTQTLAARHGRHSLIYAASFWILACGLWSALYTLRQPLMTGGRAVGEVAGWFGGDKIGELLTKLPWSVSAQLCWAVALLAVVHYLSWHLFTTIWRLCARARWRIYCRNGPGSTLWHDVLSPWVFFLAPSLPLVVGAGVALGFWPTWSRNQVGAGSAALLLITLSAVLLGSTSFAFWEQMKKEKGRLSRFWNWLSVCLLALTPLGIGHQFWYQAFASNLDRTRTALYLVATVLWVWACLREQSWPRRLASLTPLAGVAFGLWYHASWYGACGGAFAASVLSQLTLALLLPVNGPE